MNHAEQTETMSVSHVVNGVDLDILKAAVRGIEIEEVESELEGDIDLRGFLGLAADVPKGYTQIRVNFRVKAKPEDLEKLKELTAFSPVFNTATHGADVVVGVELK